MREKLGVFLLTILTGIHDPDYHSVFVRTTTVELDTNLWPEAMKMYEPYLKDEDGNFIGKAKINNQKREITFPSGARSTFTYMQYDKNADQWFGSEITRWYLDEAQHRSDYQFQIMRSRNRSRAKVSKGIYCTLNPDCESWIYDYVKPFLDVDGYPLKSLSGRTRYYVILGGQLYSDWDEESLKAKTGKTPQTYTYVPSTLDDNEVLMELDSEYRDVLDSLPEAQRRSLLEGCWLPVEGTGMYFDRKSLGRLDHLPEGCQTVRGWDLAFSVDDTEKGYYPDYTASVLMSKTPEGRYIIHDVTRFKAKPGERDNIIIQQAHEDNERYGDCLVVIPSDSAAGKQICEEFLQRLSQEGIRGAREEAIGKNTKDGKRLRYEPFSKAVHEGLVDIIQSAIDPETLPKYYHESEIFDGVTKSTRTRKDDMVDATGSAFNTLSRQKVSPILRRGQDNAPRNNLLKESGLDPDLTPTGFMQQQNNRYG